MKNTINVFLKGMTGDLHPLTITLQEYTDALNATLITFNGNELMMQNDMGNARIYESVIDKDGNIVPVLDSVTRLPIPVSLSPGFIPVGLREHGGIIYIASVNNQGVGELGSIPSPTIEYNQKHNGGVLTGLFNLSNCSETLYHKLIDDKKVNVGDVFVVSIDIPTSIPRSKRIIYYDWILSGPTSSPTVQVNPQLKLVQTFSTVDMTINNTLYTGKKGMYTFVLYTLTSDQIFKITTK